MIDVSFRNGGLTLTEQSGNKLLKENAALKNEVSMLKEEIALMQSQLDWFKRQMFGRKSEQSSAILDGGEQLA